MRKGPRRLAFSVIVGVVLLVTPLGNVPALIAQLGIGATAAKAQAQCVLLRVGAQLVWRCLSAAGRFVYRGWRNPWHVTTGGSALIGLGPAGLVSKPGAAHAPGYHSGGRLPGYTGPRFSAHQMNRMQYYAHRQNVLGHRHGPVMMPHRGPTMPAYRGSYRRR
jgi:hypothetical protein